MRKTITLLMLSLLFVMTANAQEYNLFPAADVDENGWLWFDTQAKIDKYVGLCNEDDYTVDPNGKIIQMVFANITPDYPETTADPDAYGVGTDAEFGSDGAKKGAIIIAPASGQMSTNGGCFILNLPSCSTISLYLSSEARMLMQTLKLDPNYAIDENGSDGTGNTKVIYSKASVFSALHNAGHYQWEGVATANNGNNSGVNFVSNNEVYFALRNCHKFPVYVHGIKVTTPKQETTSITELTDTDENAVEQLYSIDGKLMNNKKVAQQKGIYLLKKGHQTKKVIMK